MVKVYYYETDMSRRVCLGYELYPIDTTTVFINGHLNRGV